MYASDPFDRRASAHARHRLRGGSRDGPETATRDAEALGAELQILPDLDHLEAFSRLDLVMPAISAFLGSHGI